MTTVNQSIHRASKGALDVLRRHTLLLILFAALQLGDVVSTHLALRMGLAEGNPIPAAVLAFAGEGGMYALKLLVVVLFVVVVCRLEKRFRTNPWNAVRAMNVVMLGVVINNTSQLL